MTAPITFQPIYMERVWGGRTLETLYGRALPQPGIPFGESWEVVDRPREQSVVTGGMMPGLTLNRLWCEFRSQVFGSRGHRHPSPCFPLLLKILDAREPLSIQVHPPPQVAAKLGGEPKTEMWYVTHAEPGACLYVGLRGGVARAAFERALADGTVADLVHRVPVKAGDSIFIPSGRLHAIGAGLVIFEIQQNSDTTYRVFDWNRIGLDGKPRALHLRESLECIDFSDYEPAVLRGEEPVLADCAHFRVIRWHFASGETKPAGGACVVAVVAGQLGFGGTVFGPGEFFLVPEGARGIELFEAQEETTFLSVSLPAA
ncbi:MAG: type I phosphomannose isomerase catalytic subunit [Verrucomicrobiales bacterium]